MSRNNAAGGSQSRQGDIVTELPLSGLTVVELAHSIAAPYAGLILAELGADVIKVERTGAGDPVRDWGPPFCDGVAMAFQTYNHSKASIEVDLCDPRQRDDLLDLIVERADIVLQNLKAGSADKMGLGSAALMELKPSLIYCNVHAFGAVGPLKERPGYDPMMQAFGGLMSVTGEAETETPVRVGVSIIDMGTGMWAVMGILAALAELKREGRGRVVDVSLFETAISWMMWPLTSYLASGKVPGRQGTGVSSIVPYQVFPTKDSHLMIAAGNDNLFQRLCVATKHPEWAQDPRFATNGKRVRNRRELVPLLESALVTRSTAEWSALLAEAGVPASPLQDTAAVASNAQTLALGIIQPTPGSSVSNIALPISFNGLRPSVKGPAPRLGQDTERLLRKHET